MKTRWLKRTVALAMSLFMAATMLPATVFAENADRAQPATVHNYESTPGDEVSGKYTLQIGETAVPVVKYSANGNNMDIARFASDSRTPEMQVTVTEDINSVTVYPQRYYPQDALSISGDKRTLTFSMAQELPYAIVMINGGPADQKGKPYLALINDPLETDAPNKSSANVLNFQEFSAQYLKDHPNDTEVGKKVVEAGTTSGGQAYEEGRTVSSDTGQVRFPNKRALEKDDVSAALKAALDEIYKDGSPYDTLYFPAGTYKYSGLEIRNRKGKAVTIYLEEGALLKNRIQECMQAMEPAIGIWDSENITISGRGIFDGNGVENYRKDRHDAKDSCHQGGVMIVRSSNITFQDTYVRDAKQWNWESHGSKHCTLNNIKGLTPYNQPWVDGLDMASAQDLTINGAFTLGNDDCFASGHYNPSDGFKNTVPGFDQYNADYAQWDTEDSFNVSVKNTLGWSFGGGNGIRMGHNCYGNQMKNYAFDNVNSVNFTGGGRGITVQNSTGEYPRYESVTIKNSSFDTTRVGANAEIFGKDGQEIQEVVLENCYFNGASGAESKKFDFQNIENLTVKDLWVSGGKVSYTSDLNLNTGNISKFTFVNGSTLVEDNHLPVITFPGSTIAAYAENPLVFCVKAEDEDDGDALAYTADLGELAGKASFDSSAARFRWTPSAEDIGRSYDVKFTVADHTGKPVESSVKITVGSAQNSLKGYTVSEDAHIQSWKDEKTKNFGGTLYLTAMNTKNGEMGENGSTSTSDTTDGKIIFLKFDLAQMKEQKDLFDKAELCLTYVTLRKDGDKNKEDSLKVAAIEDDSWTEGTGSNSGNTSGGITWNTKPAFTIDTAAVKTSEPYHLGAAFQDKPGSSFAVNGSRVTVDITDIVATALRDEKETLSLVVNEANGLEHYFVSKEGASESGYASATPDMAPSIQLNIPTAIDLEGPAEMTLTEGYAAAETQSFMLKGGSGPYVVTLSGNTGNGKISWDDATNQIKVAEGLAAGTYEVTVTSTSSKDTTVTKSMVFTLTVSGVSKVTNISVSPAQANVEQGMKQAFTATVTGENNPSTEVNWSVSGGNSSQTAITKEGILSVGSDETAETLTVTAVSKADSSKSATATVTVVEKEDPKPPMQQMAELSTKIKEAEKLLDRLSEAEKQKLQPVINEVRGLLDKENVTAKEIEDALSKLKTAVEEAEKTIEPDDEKPKLNDVFDSDGLKYKITAYKGTTKNVSVIGAAKQFTTLTVPEAVSYKGERFRVTAIGDQALASQKILKSVVIGKYVVTIGKKAFYNDKKLTKVTFTGTAVKKTGKDAWKGISKKAVFVMKKTFTSKSLKYKITKCTASAKEVTITGTSKKLAFLSVPSAVTYNGMSFKVTAVNKKSFKNQSKLKSVTIGKNVKTIGSEAFSGCKKLAKVKFSGTAVKSIGKYAFKNVKKNITFNVKKSKKSSYKKLIQKAKTKNFKVK